MEDKSLLNTNALLKRDGNMATFMNRNIASNTIVETKESVAAVNARILKLQGERPAKLMYQPAIHSLL